MITQSVLASIVDQVGRSFGATPSGRGELIHLPLDYEDGDTVSVYVERIDGERYLVTDLGESAGRLDLAGVDLSRSAVDRSWNVIRRTAETEPPIFLERDVSEYEIATVARKEQLAITAMAVGAAMIRADGLRNLAPGFKPRTFAARLVRRIAEHDLTVIPDADMPIRFGGFRRVTAEIKAGEDFYTQALSSSDRTRAYDHVRALFSDAAEDLALRHKVIVIQDRMDLLPWQLQALESESTLVRESDLDHYLSNIAA